MPIHDTRSEGAYCRWETYPPEAMTVKNNILHIERVNGDASVSTFECTRGKAGALLKFLTEQHS